MHLQFSEMAQAWLKQASYPKISVSGTYDSKAQKYVVSGTQSGFSDRPWQFPFTVALMDEHGLDLIEKTFWIDSENFELEFEDLFTEPFVMSLNRNYSVFAKFFSNSDNHLSFHIVRFHKQSQNFLKPNLLNQK